MTAQIYTSLFHPPMECHGTGKSNVTEGQMTQCDGAEATPLRVCSMCDADGVGGVFVEGNACKIVDSTQYTTMCESA